MSFIRAHPRAVERIQEFGFEMGYLEFLNLMARARLVMTDSGGIQEETTILGVPLRQPFSRLRGALRAGLPDAAEEHRATGDGDAGDEAAALPSTVVGSDPQRIVAETLAILDGKGKASRVPELWNGRAAGRIVKVLESWQGRRMRKLPEEV